MHPLHPLYGLLQVSPSYALVHKEATVGLTAEEAARLPWDVGKVRETYAALGDVWATPFKHWLVKRAEKVFGLTPPPPTRSLAYLSEGQAITLVDARDFMSEYVEHREQDGNPEAVLVAIPVGDLHALEKLRPIIEGKHRNAVAAAQMPKVSEKQMQKITEGLKRVHLRARTDLFLWQIEASLLPRNHKTEKRLQYVDLDRVTADARKTKDKNRQSLTSSLNRTLLDIERYSENAARLIFPSHAEVQWKLSFDYDDLRVRLDKISPPQ